MIIQPQELKLKAAAAVACETPIDQENPMKLLVALLVAVFAASALVGCRGEAAVDTDGNAASQVPAVR